MGVGLLYLDSVFLHAVLCLFRVKNLGYQIISYQAERHLWIYQHRLQLQLPIQFGICGTCGTLGLSMVYGGFIPRCTMGIKKLGNCIVALLLSACMHACAGGAGGVQQLLQDHLQGISGAARAVPFQRGGHHRVLSAPLCSGHGPF